MATTTRSAQGARTVGVTEHVRVTPDGDEMALSVYERSAVICCEARLDRQHVAELVRLLVMWLATPAVDEWQRLVWSSAYGAKPEPVEAHIWPENWPPKPGEQWRDRLGDLWVVMPTGKLVCLANDVTEMCAEDAEDIEKRYGPMRRALTSLDAECPF